MSWPARAAAVTLCTVALAGCAGHGSQRPPARAAGPTPVVAATQAPAAPTGGGAALTRPYRERCAASLAHPSPLRAKGPGAVRKLELHSPDTSAKRRWVFVYRPGGLPDSARLPVLYILHGYPGDPANMWTKYGSAKLLDAQFSAGAAPYEVVTLDGMGVKHPDTEWADSTDGADKLETFLLSVVVPAVEGAHRRDACHRAIAGFSMGGYGAMNLAQRHPDVFGQVTSVAGYFHVDDRDGVFGGDKTAERANSPDEQVDRARGLRVFLLEGGQERLELVKGEAERFAQRLIDARIPVLLFFSPGGHTGDYALAQQPAVATFLESGWRPQPGP